MFSCTKKVKELKIFNVLQTDVSLADKIWYTMHKQQGSIACPLFSKKASLTVEAALILPLFLLACLTLLSLIDVMRITTHKQIKQQEVLRNAAVYASLSSETVAGQAGDCITFDYVYAQELPVGGFGFKKVLVRQRNMVHLFVGYDDTKGDRIGATEEYVYVTDYGKVYHTERSCQALGVSVKQVSGLDLYKKRNAEGKKYRACSSCAGGYTKKEIRQLTLYVTDYGVKYHVRANCSDLKRIVRTIKKEYAGGRSPCKLCGQ